MPYLVKPRDRSAAVTAPIPENESLPRACIIGAGSSGIAAAKALYVAGVPFDCFEAGSAIGGNWVFDNPIGRSACYETLEINTSCPSMAFSDFPMPISYPAYARHDQVHAYFEQYVDHFGFREKITFNTTVTWVTQEPDGTWLVHTDGPEGARSRTYDAVLVANGHHWDPRWPDPAYPSDFDGEQIHAHNDRSGDQLEGRDVVVGAVRHEKVAAGAPKRPDCAARLGAVVGDRAAATHRSAHVGVGSRATGFRHHHTDRASLTPCNQTASETALLRGA